MVCRLEEAEKRLSHGVFEGFSALVKACDQRSTDEGVLVFEVSPQVSRSTSVVQNQRSRPALLANVAVIVEHSKVNGRQGHQIISTR